MCLHTVALKTSAENYADYDSGESEDGRDFSRFVMRVVGGQREPVPFIDCEDLARDTLCDQNSARPLSAAEVLAVAEQVLKALTLAHGRGGLVHRNINDSTILVVRRDANGPNAAPHKKHPHQAGRLLP